MAILRPTALEIAAGRLLGAVDRPAWSPDGDGGNPRAAFERAVRTALARPPCVVSFSGGRDSSAVLAVALRVARKEGLPSPAAVTIRFRHAPGTGEREWQESVVRHLGVVDWARYEVEDELDVVGALGAGVLRRHGVVYPPNAPLVELLLREAGSGSLLVGAAGDWVLGGWPLGRVRSGGRPRRGDLEVLAAGLAPAAARRRVVASRTRAPSWLRPEAARLLAEARAAHRADEPLRFDRHLAWRARSRSSVAGRETPAELGREVGALVIDPFADSGFLAALARDGRRIGRGDRTALMRALFGDLLPEPVLAREAKAVFHHVYLRDPGRSFAASWDGSGVAHELVDVERLRRSWLAMVPDGRSLLALQAAWLASAGRQLQQPVAQSG